MEPRPHNYASYVIYSTDDLVEVAKAIGPGWVFRGQTDSKWALSSTLERAIGWADERAEYETACLKKAKLQRALLKMEGADEHDHFSWLAFLQHYGCHTRLLDFSECFYRALYFAVRGCPETDSAVWAISTRALATRLAELSESTNGCLSSEKVARQLVNNSIDWTDRYKSNDQLALAYGKPDHLNDRIRAQRGLFLCPLNLDKSFMENLTAGVGLTGKKEPVPRLSTPEELAAEARTGKAVKVCVPQSVHRDILAHLRTRDITEATLFPGPDGFARDLNYLAMGVD